MNKETKKSVQVIIYTVIFLLSVMTAVREGIVKPFDGWLNSSITHNLYASEQSEIEKIQLPSPTPTEVPTTVQYDYTKDDVVRYIREVFGKDADRGIGMLKNCENGTLGFERINWNGNGTNDFGVWQINSIHGYTHEELKDPYFNTDVAYKIFKSWGNTFSAWTCAEVAGDVPYWK